MSWPRLTGETSARYRETGDVPQISYPSGTRIRFVAPGAVTGGVTIRTRSDDFPVRGSLDRQETRTRRSHDRPRARHLPVVRHPG